MKKKLKQFIEQFSDFYNLENCEIIDECKFLNLPIIAKDGKNPDTYILVNSKTKHSLGITYVNSRFTMILKYSTVLRNKFGIQENFHIDLIDKENLSDFDVEFIKEKYFKNYLLKL